MRLTVIILLATFMQVSASGWSQNLTISVKNVTLETVLREIQRQSRFQVLYNNEEISRYRQISLTVKDAPLEQVLDKALLNTQFMYRIEDGTIILIPKQPVTAAIVPPYRVISGKVTNSKGEPLAGASITNRSNPRSTTYLAQANGTFSINADNGDVLVISFIGYERKEVTVTAESFITVVLSEKEEEMKEFVISTGYTQKTASELTGSVQKITGDEMRNSYSSANALAMLKGKTSGLYIVEGGGSVATRGQVLLRGQASLPDPNNTNFGPLIVIDGVITTATSLVDVVNANDIESINVLKDAASTALYGSRAAQGVLVIVTKRGQKGTVKINLAMKYGKTENNRLVQSMNTNQLADHINRYMLEMYNNTIAIRNQFSTFQAFSNTTRPFKDTDLNTYYNWDNAFFTSGKEKDINLSFSGGTEKTRVYGAVDWYREDGTILDDKLDRKSFRFNLDQQLSDKLTLSLNTSAIIDKYTSSTSDITFYNKQPWVTPYYANGALADSIPNYQFKVGTAPARFWMDNALNSHTYNTALRTIQNYLGTVSLKYAVFPWLSLQTVNTGQFIDNNNNSYRDPRTWGGRWDFPTSAPLYVNGLLTLNNNKTFYYLTSNRVSINKRFGSHSLSVLVGQEYGETKTEIMSVVAYDNIYPGERNLAAFRKYGSSAQVRPGALPAIPISNQSTAPVDRASFSLFTNADYNYQQRYFASASLRRDASTNFGRENRYGTFYSVSGAWLVSKEKFMNNLKPVSFLKLRAAYGTSGREAGADFLNFTVYQDNARYNDANTTGSVIQRLANEQITWETTYNTSLGMNLGLWNRLDITLDVYRRRSEDLIQTVQLPSYIGFPSQVRNVGEVVNKGLEVLVSSVNVKAREFEWTTDFNISFNKNRLTRIYNDSLVDPWSGSFYRYVGEDLNVMKAVTFRGVNPDNGRPMFERVMPDKSIVIVDSLPLVTADGIRGFKKVGSATPKFYGGITNTFRYRGITLGVLLNFVYGNTIMNQSISNFQDPVFWQQGATVVAPDKNQHFWTGPGDTKANYPNFYDLAFAQRGGMNFRSSLVMQDASYIRLRNIRLGYDLPVSFFKRVGITAMNIYITGDNLHVWKSKELIAADPEGANVGTASASYTGPGTASAMPRRFMAGINVSF